jgi:hypothetical protein
MEPGTPTPSGETAVAGTSKTPTHPLKKALRALRGDVSHPVWTPWHTVVCFVLFPVALWFVDYWHVTVGTTYDPNVSTPQAWGITIVVLAVVLAVVGQGVRGHFLGALISSRNRYSLAQLQTVVWTLVVIAGYAAAVGQNAHTKPAQAALISIPATVWGVLGISAASFVGSPLVLSGKKRSKPNKPQVHRTLKAAKPNLPADTPKTDAQGVTTVAGQVVAEGQVLVNETAADANLGEMFTGDETGNGSSIDVSKVQLFVFTAVIVLAYAIALEHTLSAASITAFPKLDSGLVALLGVSHAGYLGHKAVPHSASGD